MIVNNYQNSRKKDNFVFQKSKIITQGSSKSLEDLYALKEAAK